MSSRVFEFNKTVQRHLNCLAEDNRNVRKKALEEIKDRLYVGQDSSLGDQLSSGELQLILSENSFISPILRVFNDPIEKCREIAISIVVQGLETMPEPEELLQYIFPIMIKRLAQSEVVENSEEIRLRLVKMLILVIHSCKKNVAPYTGDIIKILEQTIIDTYPEVKKASCECVSSLAETVSSQFYSHSEPLIKPLSITITHQHSKIRVAVIKALGSTVIQNSNNKLVNDVISHLAQRLFDPVAVVRLEVIKVVGDWLLNLVDRYSFHHKLIPLLLSGMTDDVLEIREEADCLWSDVGKKYELENENELKDKMDFVKPQPDHFPPNIIRPNLGCRQLVYLHYSKILPAIIGDIGDWVAPTRIKASQLLYTLLINEEDNVTQHLDKTLETLYKGCMDENGLVVEYIMKCSELIGYYVPAHVWCKVVIQNIMLLQSSGSVLILAHVIRGSSSLQLGNHLAEIVKTLLERGICQVADHKMQTSLLMCVHSMLHTVPDRCQSIGYELLFLLLNLLALHRSQQLAAQVEGCIDVLYKIEGMCARDELMTKHARTFIEQMIPLSRDWTQHSPELLLFETFINSAGRSSIKSDMDGVLVIFKNNLEPSKNHMVRHRQNKSYTLISTLSIQQTTSKQSRGRLVDVVEKMVLPNCAWSVGRTSEVIRSSAVLCLWIILSSEIVDRDLLQEFTNKNLISQLKSLLEDDSKATRLTTCNLLTRLFNIATVEVPEDNILYNMYPDLLKRLDDSNDEVRIAAADTFASYMSCLLPSYNVPLYGAHLEEIYKGLLVHLDDHNVDVQTAIYNTLQKSCTLDPDRLLKLAADVRYKHRNSYLCEQLINHIHSIAKP
ncbi:hypothetical protein HELRODRAFT_111152 [Helobdella robusta]|uniref:TOG domain-containing protein n=1 Tax=Helobdella robusta TaxID=6412 RepID=T1EF88_HELRO|nr:hypothetical protein HELRODRAFT_111152 [Helobdella robusta]ESO05753.1 hypothetical protein HELRODRAFT_111152 [Helobdella robusta]